MGVKYKLIYYDAAGRAEPIRLLLSLANVSFEDYRFTSEEWTSLKQKMPWEQVPVLEITEDDDGGSLKKISQSIAILRYLAKKHGFYSEDHFKAGKIDECAYAIVDLNTEWWKYFYASDAVKKEDIKKSLISTIFPKYFEKLSKIQLESGGPYLLGEEMTFADILLVNLLADVEKELNSGIVDQYPLMRDLKDNIWALPQLQQYVQNR